MRLVLDRLQFRSEFSYLPSQGFKWSDQAKMVCAPHWDLGQWRPHISWPTLMKQNSLAEIFEI